MSETKAKHESFSQAVRHRRLVEVFLQSRKAAEALRAPTILPEVRQYVDQPKSFPDLPLHLIEQLIFPDKPHFPELDRFNVLANLCEVSGQVNMKEVLGGLPQTLVPPFLRAVFNPTLSEANIYAYITFRNILWDASHPEALRLYSDALDVRKMLPDFFPRHYPWEFQLIFLCLLTFLVDAKIIDANDDALRQFLGALNQQDLSKRPELVTPRIQLVFHVLQKAQDKRGVLLLTENAFKDAVGLFNAENWGEEDELIPAFKVISIGSSEFGDPDKILYFITHQIDFAKTLKLFHRSTILQKTVMAFYSNILMDVPSVDDTPVIGDIARGIYDNALTCSFQSTISLRLEAVICLATLLERTSMEVVSREIGDPSDLLRCVREQLMVEHTDLSLAALDLLAVVGERFENVHAAIARESQLHDALHKASNSKSVAVAERAFEALEKHFS